MMPSVIEGAVVGSRVKYDKQEWRVAGLNEKNGHVYLEYGAYGEKKGSVVFMTITERLAQYCKLLSEETDG